jgi:hypothetical protein
MQMSNYVRKKSVNEFIHSCIKPGSKIKTDKYKSYAFLEQNGLEHDAIRICNPKETLEYLPWVLIMIGNIKGVLKAVHHRVSSKHLHQFISEFCYKFNRRFREKFMFNDLLIACVNTQTITFTELWT